MQPRASSRPSTQQSDPHAFALRSWPSRYQMAVIWVPVTLVAWAVLVNLLVPEDAIDPVLIPTGIAIVLWGLWRAWRIALILDEHGLAARNFFRTYRARWDDVEEITAMNAHGPFGSALGFSLKEQGLIGKKAIAAQAGLAGGASESKRRCLDLLRDIAQQHGIRFMLTLEGSTFRSRPRSPLGSD
jgi:hypothetical protein